MLPLHMVGSRNKEDNIKTYPQNNTYTYQNCHSDRLNGCWSETIKYITQTSMFIYLRSASNKMFIIAEKFCEQYLYISKCSSCLIWTISASSEIFITAEIFYDSFYLHYCCQSHFIVGLEQSRSSYRNRFCLQWRSSTVLRYYYYFLDLGQRLRWVGKFFTLSQDIGSCPLLRKFSTGSHDPFCSGFAGIAMNWVQCCPWECHMRTTIGDKCGDVYMCLVQICRTAFQG